MNNWKEFVFNEPYVGGKIERINNVILPKQYVGFMKNNSDYLQKARKYGHFTGYKN